MRIIAGKGRSLPLKTIPGSDTRPTTDRIKETLFNMLSPEILECSFLDLFAGSGQIGLEAVSRGAKQAVFVENNRKAAACVQENIEFTKFTESCTLLNMDVLSAISRMEGKYCFDIVYMDPPYHQELEAEVLKALAASDLITCKTLIIVEVSQDADRSTYIEAGYQIVKEKKYKTNMHIFLERIKP